jgi:hypothetical protein
VKIGVSRPFLAILKLALESIILYKRGLIGILSLRLGALAPFRDDAARQHA